MDAQLGPKWLKNRWKIDPQIDEYFFIDFSSIFLKILTPKLIEISLIFCRLLDDVLGNEAMQKSLKTIVNTVFFEGFTNLQEIKNLRKYR